MKFVIWLLLYVLPACAAITEDPEWFARERYDFLVIGGGTAGIAVAARLSESGKYTVGLLEAGKYMKDDPLIDVPANFAQMLFHPDYDYAYPSVPQRGLNNRTIITNSGKVLGGSSAINFEAWTRASAEEYDVLGAFANDTARWGWARGFAPSFRKLDSYTPASEPASGVRSAWSWFAASVQSIFRTGNSAYHGSTGPIKTTHNPKYCDITGAFVGAANAAGIPTLTKPDSGEISGVWDSPNTVDRNTGKRVTSVTAYLEPNIHRTNLVVLTGAQASRIVWDGISEPVCATGVEFVARGKTYVVNVTREVVLSAGAMQTPQILERSGVGNPVILRDEGIEPVVDLPGVGENLQDQLFLGLVFALKPGHHTMDEARINPVFATEQQALYAKNRTGFLTATWSTVVFAPLQKIFPPSALNDTLAALDAELAARTPSPLATAQYAVQRRWLAEGRVTQWEILLAPVGGLPGTSRPAAGTSYVTLIVPQLHPFSRGSVHVGRRLDFGYFDFDFDKDVIVRAGQFARELMAKSPIAEFVETIVDPPPEANSDEQIEAYAREKIFSIQHPLGTAPLAARNIGGVVDSSLMVYGVENVRVADASVIMLQLSTHPQATVYAIAEKAAEMILATAAT